MKNKRLLLLDNFDSFVYNLYQYFAELGYKVDVERNNALTLEEIKTRHYDRIVISPGPGNPEKKADFGVCSEVIKQLGPQIPILGVCLGHQGIVSALGGKIIRAEKPMHGKTSTIHHNGTGIFNGIKNPLRVMRYHSLIAEESSLPDCLVITAKSNDDKAIMAVRHREYPIIGIQFHPESILTEEGKKLLQNFCNIEVNHD